MWAIAMKVAKDTRRRKQDRARERRRVNLRVREEEGKGMRVLVRLCMDKGEGGKAKERLNGKECKNRMPLRD